VSNKDESIKKLVLKILEHKKLYYSGKAIITDYEYDELEDDLAALDPNHDILNMIGFDPNYKS